MVAPRDPVTPNAKDVKLARESGRRLAARGERALRLRVGRGKPVTLPAAAVKLLVEMLREMGAGNSVALVPIHAELSTQQAAEFLGVSRPFLVKQMEEGRLPFRRVGAHRRALVRDLLAYKRSTDEARSKALDELAAQAQELGMGY